MMLELLKIYTEKFWLMDSLQTHAVIFHKLYMKPFKSLKFWQNLFKRDWQKNV